MKFKAGKGASFGQDRAQRYCEELERLQKLNNGELTPHIVLAIAKIKSNPLHDFFEWDNDKASAKWRLHQARLLLNSVEIVVIHHGKEEDVRRYLNVTQISNEDNDDSNRVYVIMEKGLSDPEYRRQILQTAINEVEYWNKKYKQYKELIPIFKSIYIVKKKIIK